MSSFIKGQSLIEKLTVWICQARLYFLVQVVCYDGILSRNPPLSCRSLWPYIVGVTLHTSFSDAQTLGTAVDKIFISDNLHLPCIKDLAIGQTVDIEYNNRGFVCGCEIVGK